MFSVGEIFNYLFCMSVAADALFFMYVGQTWEIGMLGKGIDV